MATIFVIWLSFRFGRAIVSATSEVWGWAHAHPVTKYVTAILGSVGLGAILTPQDMALLIILLVITCYLLPIPRIMLNVMRFLASKLGAFWTDFQPTNTTLQQYGDYGRDRAGAARTPGHDGNPLASLSPAP